MTQIEMVTGAQAPETALSLLAGAAPPPADEKPAAEAVPAKRRGGFPKGAKRGPGGKKVTAGEPAAPAAPARAPRVYDGTGDDAPPAPIPSRAPMLTLDTALNESVKPYMRITLKVLTRLAARLAHDPTLVATEAELDELTEGGSPVLTLYIQQQMAAAGESEVDPMKLAMGGAAVAVLGYAAPRLANMFTAPADGLVKSDLPAGGPVAVVPPPPAPAAPPAWVPAETGPV